jgi:hypothetical protein
MKIIPRGAIAAKKTGKYRENKKISLAPLGLEKYNAWKENRSAIRQWLVQQIAERAVQIFQNRRNEL